GGLGVGGDGGGRWAGVERQRGEVLGEGLQVGEVLAGEAAGAFGDDDGGGGLGVAEGRLELDDLGRFGRGGQEGGAVVLGHFAELARVGAADGGQSQPCEH